MFEFKNQILTDIEDIIRKEKKIKDEKLEELLKIIEQCYIDDGFVNGVKIEPKEED